HIGINTVEANGDGFKVLNFKQGDEVKAGDPIVTVDFKKLGAKYDMSTMLIVTNANGQTITFRQPGDVKRGESVLA
ncbi:MAG TPA: PTS glucose transporter subunit IIA, partial [Erysipelotrichaceae bacterium]|nr:PTS glucose transporter subunit IIA [Erysipelotrichaceae bacterium]